MKRKSKKKLVLMFLTLSGVLGATDATWTGVVSSDLNTAGNWVGNAVPTGIATFNSNYPRTQFFPTADAIFNIDSIYFPGSASAFTFTFTGPGALNFTGIGITGGYTNTQINGTNSTTLDTAQLFFTPNTNTSASIGNASFLFTNTAAGTISFNNAGQIVFGDTDNVPSVPVTGGGNVTLSVINNGIISGGNEAGQIFLKGTSFTAGDNLTVNATNTGAGSSITSNSDTGQLVLDAGTTAANFQAGDNAAFNFYNGSVTSSGTLSSIDRGNNVGQIIFDGKRGTSAFTLGDHATFNLLNQNSSTISTVSSGNDAGQMVFDGNNGTASFTAGDYLSFALSNTGGSTISGLGFDTGQLVVDGDGGTASFTTGNYANISLNNAGASFIEGGSNGNDSGQMVFDGNGGTSSFTTGTYANITLNNAGGSTITSYYNSGQIVADGDGGSVSFTLGDNSTLSVTNSGDINNSIAGSIVAQIAFNGSEASGAGVYLNAGSNVSITATNTSEGTITNAGVDPAAQIYFSSASITGNPTITAVNQHAGLGSIEGIVFDGISTASKTNIGLVNTSLVVNTTSSPFTIGSLTGDSTSVVKLHQDFEISTASGVSTTFAGVIYDVSGSNNLIISGSGKQVLGGVNTFGGTTIINGGNLALTGSVLHDVEVNTTGTFSGTGIVHGNVTVYNGGTINPGMSIGTLSLKQNYTQTSSGTYTVQVSGAIAQDGSPESSLLDITGTANLDGTLSVVSADGTYSIGRPYTILTAGTINGSFSQVVLPTAFLKYQTTYNPDPSVQLVLSTDFLSGAKTSNQKHVAKQIDGIAVPVGNEEVVIDNLLSLDRKQLRAALDEMSGEQYAYLIEMNQYGDYRFGKRIFEAVRHSLDVCACQVVSGDWNIWSAFEAGHGAFYSKKRVRGFRENRFDFSLGADTLCDHTLWGMAANFEGDCITFNRRRENTLYNFQGGAYGAYITPGYYVFSDFILGGGFCHFKRKIKFADLNQKAHGKPNCAHGLWYAEWGWNHRLCDILAQPFIGVDCRYAYAPKFSEKGGKSLNLRIDGRSVWSSNLYFGTHLSTTCDCIQFNGDLVYQYRFGSLGTTLHSRFVDFGDAFTVRGRQYSRNGFFGSLNAEFNVDQCSKLYVEFSGDFWDHRCNYAGTLGIRSVW